MREKCLLLHGLNLCWNLHKAKLLWGGHFCVCFVPREEEAVAGSDCYLAMQLLRLLSLKYFVIIMEIIYELLQHPSAQGNNLLDCTSIIVFCFMIKPFDV
jgi:hypothetical protein